MSAALRVERLGDGPIVRPRMDARMGTNVNGPARQLRDPAIFEEDGQTYLLYAVAGEQGLAIARLIEREEESEG